MAPEDLRLLQAAMLRYKAHAEAHHRPEQMSQYAYLWVALREGVVVAFALSFKKLREDLAALDVPLEAVGVAYLDKYGER